MSDGNFVTPSDNEVYFAARKPEDAAAAILQKSESFYNNLESNQYLDKLIRMYQYYYGSYNNDDSSSGHTVTFAGEQGELVQLPVNHFRNLARNIYNMIIANRPTLEARAANSDYKSLSQTYLANGILDYYMREKGLEEAVNDAVEMAIVLGASFIKMAWNSMKGSVYEVDENQQPIYEGEMEFSVHSPLDVVVDGTKERWDNEWINVRSYVNRYNLIAKYPQYAKQIIQLETKNNSRNSGLAYFSNDNTDDIPVYEFFHKKTEAMPDGRYLLFLSDEIVLLDTPLPYREIPVFRLAPSNIMGTPYGYSDMFDVFPIQEMMNSIYSGISSNQNAFLVQSVFTERGSDLTVESLEGGLNIIEGNKPPQPIQMTSSPKEAFDFLKLLEQAAETLVGVNSVTRGNPEASLRSGTALALVQSMSIQFQSGFQKAYVKFLENVGTNLIEILKDYANTPKLVALVGKNKAPLLKQFTGDQIKDIQRVIVEVGNPLARTIAGRVQIAEQMAQMKMIKNPQQYFQVLETGSLDSMIEGDMSDLLNIKRENELMLEGQEVFADILDQHRMHIIEHRVLINDPDLRSNPDLYTAVKNHIQEHINMLRTVDPDLLMLIGEQPLAPPMVEQGLPGAPGGQPLPPQAGEPGGPMGNKEAIENGQTQEVMDQSMAGAQAPADQVIDGQPTVDGTLLPDPSLEPRAKF
jgi:hypothetical protein